MVEAGTLRARVLGIDREIGPHHMARYGRLVGFLFITGSVAVLPGAELLTDGIDRDAVLITALGVVSGVLCLTVVPWSSVPVWGLYVVIAIGVGEVALAAEIVDPIYSVLYFIAIAYAALVVPTRTGLVLVLCLIFVLLAQPAIDSPETREQLGVLTLLAPTLAIVAATIRYLQETLEVREGRTRAFARQALELAIRIRGGEEAAGNTDDPELAELRRSLESLR